MSLARSRRSAIIGFTVVAILTLPLVVQDDYLLLLASNFFILAIAATALNLIYGYTGQMSIGQAGFYAIGAYASVLLSLRLGWSFWLATVVGMLLASVVGVLIGIPTLRLSGSYLIMATIGFGIIVEVVLTQWVEVTAGAIGIVGIPRPAVFGYQLGSFADLYYLNLVAFLLAFGLVRNLVQSPIGHALLAVRESESAAATVGVNAAFYKNLAFVIGAGLTALAGSLYAVLNAYINPSSFTIDTSVLFLIAVIVGGAGRLAGSLWGAAFLTVVPELVKAGGAFHTVIFGAALVLVLVFAPGGIASLTDVIAAKLPWQGSHRRVRHQQPLEERA